MKFIFDCADEVCLPAAYYLVDDASDFLKKMKTVDIDTSETTEKSEDPTRISNIKLIIKNMMVNYPKETSNILSKLWILDEGEVAPNTFVTMGVLFSHKTAIDFFTSALPCLVALSKPLLQKQNPKN